MTRKEEIILATLDLAAEQGLSSVTLSQIAQRIGMKAPSLYNHFSSKDDIMQEAYRYLREQASGRATGLGEDYAALFEGRDLEEILLASLHRYCAFVLDEDLFRLWRVLYAERSHDPVAARLVVEETEHMVEQVKVLFYALAVHGKLRCDDVDGAALSFAMAVHATVDYRLDKLEAAGLSISDATAVFDAAKAVVSWFARQLEATHA